jgi:2'-hydroxyisoflavone reductase
VRLLVLGGTVFLGRAVVEAALARGHEVTLFNRGRQNPELFPGVERLRGDRDRDLSALSGRTWDAVVDPSGFTAEQVRATAELLAEAVDRYTFVSTIAVYPRFPERGMDETAPLHEGSGSYGADKARAEEAAEAAMPGRVLHVRAGLLVGPHDPTDRFTYWPRRVAAGGDVLAPGRPERPVQFVDARDVAEWIVSAAEGRLAGPFNVTGPAEPLTMAELVEACRRVSGSDARFVWVDDSALLAAKVEPWSELPLWWPETEPDARGFLSIDVSRALAAGLAFRPLDETIRDTLAWDRGGGAQPTERPIRVTPLAREREAELLARVASAAAG